MMKRFVLLLLVLFIVLLPACCGGPGYYSPSATPPSPQTAPLPPSAPSNLTAEAVSYNQVELHWFDNSDNEDGFKLYRDNQLIATLPLNTIVYQDIDLDPGTIYNYTVSAFNHVGESKACSWTVRTPNPPITVRLDRIGVYDNREDWTRGKDGEVYVYVVVSDGNKTTEAMRFPQPEEQHYELEKNETVDIGAAIFSEDEVGDSLTITVVGYESDGGDFEPLVYEALTGAMLSSTGVGGAVIGGVLEAFGIGMEEIIASFFGTEDDFLGSYENAWDSDNNWGIGSYTDIALEDERGIRCLRLWFTIENPMEPLSVLPPPTPSKTVEAKGLSVTIEDADVPAEVEVGRTYTYNITLRNNESRSVTVTLKIHSSVTGDVSSESVIVPANSTTDVQNTTKFQPAGVRTITYTILYKGEELDSLSKTVEAKEIEELSIEFDGWYVGDSKVNTANKHDTVTAKITLSGGDAGQYEMRIRRDISLAADRTVNELSFSYDGVSATKELSFTPPYATGEASTIGYHIDLLKNGYGIWSLTNAYPPRLRVTQ